MSGRLGLYSYFSMAYQCTALESFQCGQQQVGVVGGWTWGRQLAVSPTGHTHTLTAVTQRFSREVFTSSGDRGLDKYRCDAASLQSVPQAIHRNLLLDAKLGCPEVVYVSRACFKGGESKTRPSCPLLTLCPLPHQVLSYHATCSKAEVDKFKVRKAVVALSAHEVKPCLTLSFSLWATVWAERLAVLRFRGAEGFHGGVVPVRCTWVRTSFHLLSVQIRGGDGEEPV